jgi:hypothetical protein
MPTGVPEAPLIDRFLRKVNKDGGVVREELGQCWLWTGGTCGKVDAPYGQLVVKVWGEKLAHRWSYLHFNGAIADGLMVRHKCDVRLCVNPAHLELGEAKDNVRDMVERNPKACGRKVTDDEIVQIKALRESGLFYQQIADIYGYSRRTIEWICLGKKTYTQ